MTTPDSQKDVEKIQNRIHRLLQHAITKYLIGHSVQNIPESHNVNLRLDVAREFTQKIMVPINAALQTERQRLEAALIEVKRLQDEGLQKFAKSAKAEKVDIVVVRADDMNRILARAESAEAEIARHRQLCLEKHELIEKQQGQIRELRAEVRAYQSGASVQILRDRVSVLEGALREVQRFILGEGGIPHALGKEQAGIMSQLIDAALNAKSPEGVKDE